MSGSSDGPSSRLSADEVRHVARLARLSLPDADIEQFRSDLSAVLAHVATIQAIDVGATPPFTRPGDLTARERDLAADIPHPGMPVEDLLGLAPRAEPPYIAVPKVLGS